MYIYITRTRPRRTTSRTPTRPRRLARRRGRRESSPRHGSAHSSACSSIRRRAGLPALASPSLITTLAEKLGSQAVVVAIDTEDGRVRTRAGTTETARGTVEWAVEAEQRGAGEILLTSIDADGTREGYDLEITSAVAE